MKFDITNLTKNKAYIYLTVSLLILFAITTLVAIFNQKSNLFVVLAIFSGLVIIISAYLRMYYVFKLERCKKKHNHLKFADYIVNLFESRYELIFIVLPDFRKYNMYYLYNYSKEEVC